MSVVDDTVLISYLCDGAQFEFTIPFAYWAEENVLVELKGPTGIISDLEYGVDYIVSESTLTTVAIYDTGTTLSIYRKTSKTQETSRVKNSLISSAVIDSDFDKGTMIDQETDYSSKRVIRTPMSDDEVDTLPPKELRGNMILSFDATGSPVADVPDTLKGEKGDTGEKGDKGDQGEVGDNYWEGSARFISTSDPTSGDGVNGDFWFKY